MYYVGLDLQKKYVTGFCEEHEPVVAVERRCEEPRRHLVTDARPYQ